VHTHLIIPILTNIKVVKGAYMKPKIVKAKSLTEYSTPERCLLYESYSDDKVSIARARVKPGVTTVAHHLKGATEIYIITRGRGKVKVGDLQPTEVAAGDVVVIPAGVSQKITNTGKTDLVFQCVCTPRFTPDCYFTEEETERKSL
jgi:mannose-6-phosphate isomerase-like protein (cupin superfamily)